MIGLHRPAASCAQTSWSALTKKSAGKSWTDIERLPPPLGADVQTARPMAECGTSLRRPRERSRLAERNPTVIRRGIAERAIFKPLPTQFRAIKLDTTARSTRNISHLFDVPGHSWDELSNVRPRTVREAITIEELTTFGPSIPPAGVESCTSDVMAAGPIS